MNIYEGLKKIDYTFFEPFRQLFNYSQLAPVSASSGYAVQPSYFCNSISESLTMERGGGQDRRRTRRGGGQGGFRRGKNTHWVIEKGKNQRKNKRKQR
ncbi:MAG: hypothetical protein ABIH72_02060 [archaeon]